MYLDIRTNKDGTVQYRFTYLDETGKRRRFPQSKVPHFNSRTEAEAWARSQAGIIDAKRADIEKRLSWRSKYYQFEDLLKRYTEWQKERAPNSWESCVHYLEHWVFSYYLINRQAANPNDWYLSFQDFRDWLKHPDRLTKRGKKAPLAVATQNNIIKALNTFLTCLHTYNLIDPLSAQKCEAYPEHKLNRRDSTAVIDEVERNKVVDKLLLTYEPAADFFLVLWHTGMRFSELWGLPITALFKGEVPKGTLQTKLAKADITYYGYLYLDSQPKFDDRAREADHSLSRRPLKGCKSINPRFARIIPIQSKGVWNVLAKRYKLQLEEFAKKRFGGDKSSYLLFEDAEWNRLNQSLRSAYENLGLAPKGYHCCRHTFTTLLVGDTGDPMLVRLITGHRSQGAFERYLHVYEQLALAARQKAQDIDLIS